MKILVECYSGYRGEETPRSLLIGGSRIPVREVIDRWLAQDHRYFKVAVEDGSIYIIRHDTASWEWEVTFYRDITTPKDPPPLPRFGPTC
jgi:hypothetical protein